MQNNLLNITNALHNSAANFCVAEVIHFKKSILTCLLMILSMQFVFRKFFMAAEKAPPSLPLPHSTKQAGMWLLLSRSRRLGYGLGISVV
jgi:hypothetical protein